MTPAAALLTLLAAAPPLALVRSAERIALPASASPVVLRPRPFERRLTLEVPRGSVGAVARRLTGASRLCPGVERGPGPGAVTLVCRSPDLRATLDPVPGEPTLDLRSLSVPPWRPDDGGVPIVPLDPAQLGLGRCPGRTPEAQGECLLDAGHAAEARARFAVASGAGPAPLAELRLGDLALADDDLEAAEAHWRRARSEYPYGRMAQARLCELEPSCIGDAEARAPVFDPGQVPPAVRHDMTIRAARIQALTGDLSGALRTLAPEMTPGGACAGVMRWCGDLLLLGLRAPTPTGSTALALYLELPDRSPGPFPPALALALTRAAADQAADAGAPVFAANLLAAVTGRIPDAALPSHLHRVAALFLDGGDRARAEEIVLYARAHLSPSDWRRDGWDALRGQVRRRAAPPPGEAAPPDGAPADPDLAAASSAAEAARLVLLSQGVRP